MAFLNKGQDSFVGRQNQYQIPKKDLDFFERWIFLDVIEDAYYRLT
jgi:hypothetical protein